MEDFRTYKIAVEFYHCVAGLELKGALSNQLDRASSSIALNLAEGYGRRTQKDKRHFYTIAYGSLKECKTILALAMVEEPHILQCLDRLGAHTYKLIQSMN